MSPIPPDSSVARRVLGLTLETMREQRGITRDVAADAIGVTRSTLWRIESGQNTRLSTRQLEQLCALCEAGPKQARTVLALMRQAATPGRWRALAEDAIPKEFGLLVSLENTASRITSYQLATLPGLLHTAAYRRSLIWAEFPNKTRDEVERLLRVGLERQHRLTDPAAPVHLAAVIDESILHRPTGGAAIMRDQLRHLSEVAALPNVSLRVVPRTAGIYRALFTGTFVILDFPAQRARKRTIPPVVYVQTCVRDLYLENPGVIRRCRDTCADLERLALDEAGSLALILRIAKEYAR
ncbi:MAG: helix-turn-helix domain-containing protein [Nocardia sp.]|nr:helix-turn-helix domain-containing protein [Nocardia sp.]